MVATFASTVATLLALASVVTTVTFATTRVVVGELEVENIVSCHPAFTLMLFVFAVMLAIVLMENHAIHGIFVSSVGTAIVLEAFVFVLNVALLQNWSNPSFFRLCLHVFLESHCVLLLFFWLWCWSFFWGFVLNISIGGAGSIFGHTLGLLAPVVFSAAIASLLAFAAASAAQMAVEFTATTVPALAFALAPFAIVVATTIAFPPAFTFAWFDGLVRSIVGVLMIVITVLATATVVTAFGA